MSKRKYPFIGDEFKGDKPCVLCGCSKTGKIHIQVNWFRGDDEVYDVCKQCANRPSVAEELNLKEGK